MIAPIGGDQVAQIASMLLVPILLGDQRRWQRFAPDSPVAPRRRGGAYAAHLALRCQVAIVYLVASDAKVLSPTWRRGTAMRVIFQNPDFGVPPQLLSAFRPLFQSYPLSVAVGWSVIAIELGIAASMFGPRRFRVRGLMLAVLLHAGIIVLMGLFGFGLTMIGTVAVTCSAGALRQGPRRRDTQPPSDVPAVVHERDKSSSTSASTVAMVAVVV